jgi:hypothetical protein
MLSFGSRDDRNDELPDGPLAEAAERYREGGPTFEDRIWTLHEAVDHYPGMTATQYNTFVKLIHGQPLPISVVADVMKK